MTFGLITEGASEHRVIKHIISRYFKDDDPEINQIQPIIEKDTQVNAGGWNEVLKYCSRAEDLKEVLINNDYLIIQIDTDQCETNPFCVNRQEGGIDLDHETLHRRIIERLLRDMPEEHRESNCIIYAVCIHSIECWLLPIFCTRTAQKIRTNNCLDALNRELRRNDIHIITDKNSPQAIASYEKILSNIKKIENIENCSSHNTGFLKFIEQLQKIKLNIAPI